MMPGQGFVKKWLEVKLTVSDAFLAASSFMACMSALQDAIYQVAQTAFWPLQKLSEL